MKPTVQKVQKLVDSDFFCSKLFLSFVALTHCILNNAYPFDEKYLNCSVTNSSADLTPCGKGGNKAPFRPILGLYIVSKLN